jgi:hypothetical protein
MDQGLLIAILRACDFFVRGSWFAGCWVPHTPILRVGLEPNPHDILSAAKNLSAAKAD